MEMSIKNTVFWYITLHTSADKYRHFGRTCHHHLQERSSNPEDGGSRFLPYFDIYLFNYTASHPKIHIAIVYLVDMLK
jgi:hypothetical protein